MKTGFSKKQKKKIEFDKKWRELLNEHGLLEQPVQFNIISQKQKCLVTLNGHAISECEKDGSIYVKILDKQGRYWYKLKDNVRYL